MSLKKNLLGKTGIEVTELCIGTLILGSLQANLTPEEGAPAVRRALKRGINFIDTAMGYKTYQHILKGAEGFKDYIVASKSPVSDPGQMMNHVDDCLRQLNRDTIDIFHLHLIKSVEDMKNREGVLHTLVKCKEAGKIRAIGLSAHGPDGVIAALGYDEIEVVFPLLNSKGLGINGGTRDKMVEAVHRVADKGLGLYVMKPLAGGHLIDDIPSAISYIRDLELFDSISVGLKTPEEVDIMIGVFENDADAIEKALRIGKEKAGKKRLIVYEFQCERCGACVDACAQEAISVGEKSAVVNHSKCILCGYCAAACPKFAIRVV